MKSTEKLRMKIAQWRSALADLPRLISDLRDYTRFRRNIYRDLEFRGRGIEPIECVGLRPALERIHQRRFPDRPWEEHRSLQLEFSEEFNTLETIYLAMICRIAEPQGVFEIGTYEGRTANVMALHTPPGCRIHTLDLPPDSSHRTRLPLGAGDKPWLRKEDGAPGARLGTLPDPADNKRIEPLFGDSATFDFSAYHGRMDLVFVDGAHSYDYVMSDVKNALKMLTPRGFILMHDLLTHSGVTLAAMTLRHDHEIIHVAQTSFGILFPSAAPAPPNPL